MIKYTKKELFNIPNILTYLRILSIPFYMYFVISGGLNNITKYVYIGLAIFLIAASTDLFDGAFARKFIQVTDIGKVLDPLADKLMHMTVLLSLVIIGYVHWIFIIVIAAKELTMVFFGIYLTKNNVVLQANMMGKIASAVLSAGVLLSFFNSFYTKWDLIWILCPNNIVLIIAVILTYTAFVNYGLVALKDLKRIKSEKKTNLQKGEENE